LKMKLRSCRRFIIMMCVRGDNYYKRSLPLLS